MFSLMRHGRRTLMTSLKRKGEPAYSIGYRVLPADDPAMQRTYNTAVTLLFSVMFYSAYHFFYEVTNHGRGYIPASTLSNEQLGLPPQGELIRIAHAIKFGAAMPAEAEEDDEE